MFSKLTRLSIKVSSYCNLDCVYCHQLSGDKSSARRFVLYSELKDFLLKCSLADIVQVTLTGGEVSIAMEEFRRAVKELNAINTANQTIFKPNIVTNGSNWPAIVKALKQKIVSPEDITLSWDGLYSYTKTRRGKNKHYSDEHFNQNIEWIGANNMGRKINISYAITPQTIEDMYDSLCFALDAGARNFSFYYIHEGNYSDASFKTTFADQLEKIADLFVKRYHDPDARFAYYNWQRIYTASFGESNFLDSTTCKKLGNTLHFDIDGSIYGCIYFGDHKALQLGHLLDGGIYADRLDTFINEYLALPTCNWQGCSYGFCFECPASNYVHNESMQQKTNNLCELYAIEKSIFDAYISKITINKFDEANWAIKDAESSNHLAAKKQAKPVLPLASKNDYKIPDMRIASETLLEVKNWQS